MLKEVSHKWWYRPVIPQLWWLNQEARTFETILGFTEKLHENINY